MEGGGGADSLYSDNVIDYHNSHNCHHDMHQQSVMASFTGTSVLHQNEYEDDASVPTPPKFHIQGLVNFNRVVEFFLFVLLLSIIGVFLHIFCKEQN